MKWTLPALTTSANNQPILNELHHMARSHIRRWKGKLDHLVTTLVGSVLS